jgi:hypothetical protein
MAPGNCVFPANATALHCQLWISLHSSEQTRRKDEKDEHGITTARGGMEGVEACLQPSWGSWPASTEDLHLIAAWCRPSSLDCNKKPKRFQYSATAASTYALCPVCPQHTPRWFIVPMCQISDADLESNHADLASVADISSSNHSHTDYNHTDYVTATTFAKAGPC